MAMHDWDHNGKIDLNDGFIQDEIESRNSGGAVGSGGSGSGGGPGLGGAGSGGCCIIILLIPVLIMFIWFKVNGAPDGIYEILFFFAFVAVMIGGLL